MWIFVKAITREIHNVSYYEIKVLGSFQVGCHGCSYEYLKYHTRCGKGYPNSMDDTVWHQGRYPESFNLISLVEMCQEGGGPSLGVLWTH